MKSRAKPNPHRLNYAELIKLKNRPPIADFEEEDRHRSSRYIDRDRDRYVKPAK